MGAFKEPHGGTLIDLYLSESAAEEEKTRAMDFKSWDLTDRQQCDIDLILNGAFSPLDGFLNQPDYQAVLSDMRLSSGVLWPIPINLDVTEEFAESLETGEWIALRDGEGVMPVKLAGRSILEPPFDPNTPDINIQDHPIFDFFLGERNPLIRRVTVEQFIQPDSQWKPAKDSTAQVVTRLHNGQPLVVEQRFGEGRVVCFLTTAAPSWNNWAQDPSFVVVTLKLHAYLTAIGRVNDVRLVGQPATVSLAVDQ